MTMQHQIHPDDERLAALAGADPDAVADAELSAHVSACDRCGPMVAELSMLRSALTELPDLVPSRRLQLLPPVAEPRAASGGWLRRLAAPVMAGGFGLVLVGAIGTSGILNFGQAASGGAPTEFNREDDTSSPLVAAGQSPASESSQHSRAATDSLGAAPGATSTDGSQVAPSTGDSESFITPDAGGDNNLGLFSNADPRLPWLVLIGLGVGLLLAGVYLRFSTQPRAG